jgi:hypothetical protein
MFFLQNNLHYYVQAKKVLKPQTLLVQMATVFKVQNTPLIVGNIIHVAVHSEDEAMVDHHSAAVADLSEVCCMRVLRANMHIEYI